jgi:hypothetical protein
VSPVLRRARANVPATAWPTASVGGPIPAGAPECTVVHDSARGGGSAYGGTDFAVAQAMLVEARVGPAEVARPDVRPARATFAPRTGAAA